MNAYVCVYRQPIVKRSDWNKTKREALSTPGLEEYLRRYNARFRKGKKKLGYFYDWGDDPSFFAAEEFLDDVNQAGWGVCRRDVRKQLKNKGDFVVFFCAQQQEDDSDLWKYYFIGVGTVGSVIKNRKLIWLKDKYKDYRKFYNLLIDSEGRQSEKIHRFHRDWEKRAKSPYLVFSKNKTHFNLVAPLLVAEYRIGDSAWKGEILESWLPDDDVQEIFELIPTREKGKKLRTSHINGNDHQAMNLADIVSKKQKQSIRRKYRVKQVRGELRGLANKRKERRLKRLREALLKISKEIAGR